MDAKQAYDLGYSTLERLWENTDEGSKNLSQLLRAKIATILADDAQVAHRYALVNQLLLKLILPSVDSRSLEGLGEDDFTARTFAKATVAKFKPVTGRLGNSSDPYVTNPLRTPRLEDKLKTDARGAKHREKWNALLDVLDAVEANPEYIEAALCHSLDLVSEFPYEVPSKKAESAAPVVPRDLSSLLSQSGIEENLLLDILDTLESDQPQIILAGPPGTSKTHTAQALASYLTDADKSRVTTVQLHATYGYEDFVEGLRPVASDTGTLTFQVEPGVIRRLAESPGKPGESKVLILDEMNRANLPRVLGELLFAIERRDESVDLLHTKDFRLPPEIRIIGTMNTADRNIRSLDAAVRRRFMVYELEPSEYTLRDFYKKHDNEILDLIEGFIALNEELARQLDRHHTIGHTYLMDERGMTYGRLNQIWLRQLHPLIEEYLFDLPDELSHFSLETFWPSVTTG